jgi:DNA-binding beta-propeller fold protein YncE
MRGCPVIVAHGFLRCHVVEKNKIMLAKHTKYPWSKMNFLPAVPLSAVPAAKGYGGAAVNSDGTLLASVDRGQHCVYMYSIDGDGKRTADAVVVGTAGTAGSSHGQFNSPRHACFAHRYGADTLLICDAGNDRVVEVTLCGVFLRAIAVQYPHGIAYCGINDVIALSLFEANAVVLLQYESGAVKVELTVGLGTGANGCDDGQLYYPRGVTFTADGRCILVADWGNNRVCKFSAANGAFIAHVATRAANGIQFPTDVLQCEDGSILVAQGYSSGSVVCMDANAVTVQNIIIPFTSAVISFSNFLTLGGVVVKTMGGNMFLSRDAWMSSNRCAWLSALSCS